MKQVLGKIGSGNVSNIGTVSAEAAEGYLTLFRAVETTADAMDVTPAAVRRAVRLTLKKSDDPAGDPAFTRKELADCILSVWNLAAALALELPPGGGEETQDSVALWCDEHYRDTPSQKLINLVEETVELGAVLGIGSSPMLAARRPVDLGFSAAIRTAERALRDLSAVLGVDLNEALDEVMANNRKRTVAESAARSQRKRSLGLVG